MTPPDCLLERERLIQAHADWSREIAALDRRIAATAEAIEQMAPEQITIAAVLADVEARRDPAHALARDIACARRERDDLIALVTAWSARAWPSPPAVFRAAPPTERTRPS